MAIDLSGIIEQVGLQMQAETRDELMTQLDTAAEKMSVWLIKAKAYQAFQNSNLKEMQTQISLGKRAQANLDKFFAGSQGEIFNHPELAASRLEQATQETAFYQAQQKQDEAFQTTLSRSLLLEGYELLNEMGEAVRQEPIQYSVTVTGSGDWGTAAPNDTITWTVDYSIFKNLITTSRTRLMLKDSSSILSLMANNASASMQSWDKQRILAYNKFHEQINMGRAENRQINRGNTLEAFLLMEANNLTPDQALQDTLSHSIPFYAGGDIGNIQIKGMNASVTNLSTMINAMYSTYTQITTIKQKIIALSKKKPESKSAKRLDDSINKAIVSLLNKYGFK